MFWSSSNHFGHVQILKISPEMSNLNLTKMIWTQPKQFGHDQNNLNPSKTIWTVQNHFGPKLWTYRRTRHETHVRAFFTVFISFVAGIRGVELSNIVLIFTFLQVQ